METQDSTAHLQVTEDHRLPSVPHSEQALARAGTTFPLTAFESPVVPGVLLSPW